jgi:phosphoglycolate phosphatase-like HAD superfamily hydrolase
MHLLKNFDAHAIIFDKDGTLIDFDAMWGDWTLQLADRMLTLANLDIRLPLCDSFGYDLHTKKILPDGNLASATIWRLREIMLNVTQAAGVSYEEADRAVEQAWIVPDPVALAKPLTDIHKLFTNIRNRGIKIAIATADDRAPTEAMLEAFNANHLVSTLVCADDGIKAKPAPDMVFAICARLGIHQSKVIVIGDTVADLTMARSSGAGMAIGVLSGVGSLEKLTPLADLLIDTVDTLQESFVVTQVTKINALDTTQPFKDLNPDPAF